MDWRFRKAPLTIPLAQAKASVETTGVPVESAAFDDSSWDVVSLPHAINAQDSFDDRAVDAGEANFWRGMAFYRKRFSLPVAKSDERKVMSEGGCKYFISFETVRQTLYVWVNGKMVGYYEAGIAPTCFDVTDAVKDGENLLVVATDNCAARGTKVFTHETVPGHAPGDGSGGSYQWNTADFNEVQGGLTGAVRLHVKRAKAYLTLPYYNNLKTVGTYVTAKDFDFAAGAATVVVRAEVRNEGMRDQGLGIRVSLADPVSGNEIGRFESEEVSVPVAKDKGTLYLTALEADVYEMAPRPTRVAGPVTQVIAVEVPVKGLVFWSPETPRLYDVKVELVSADGKTMDDETIRTGFRHVAYDAAKGGLLINGKNVWLTGYAQRSTDEWAVIGVAPDWLQDFDAKLIRESNANFVRWMHVAPKPAPVRAFDKYGVVCVVPAGDKEGDVSGRAWGQRTEAMRDAMISFRNSPSVLFWEAGNNQITPAHMKEMRELKELLDPAGGRFMGSRTLQTPEQVKESEYVGTMLHRHELPAFESMRKTGRLQPIVETEYARQESPRRCWDDYSPPHYDYVCRFLGGGKKETGFDVYDQTQEDFALSTAREYAEFYANWSNGAGPRTYAACAALCWTDSNQHGRQSGSENCRSSGRVDAVRVPKMNFWTFRTMQSAEPSIRIVGHWNYPRRGPDTYWYREKAFDGKYWKETGRKLQRDPTKKTVYVIGSPHVAKVELFVNGTSKGVCEKPDHLFVWSFPEVDVTASGEILAVATDRDGREIARDRIETAGTPAKLVLTPQTGPEGFLADGADIALVDVKLVDAKGRVCPLAEDRIEFKMSFGEGGSSPVFLGGYNSGVWGEASPIGKDWVKLECGRNRVFVRAGRTAGELTLTARLSESGAGIPEARTQIVVKPVAADRANFQGDAPNGRTYVPKIRAEVVQNVLSGTTGAIPYEVRVNGTPVKFTLGAPVKPDANTGVCAAYVPVLEALKASGAALEFTADPKKIPANKKYLRKLAASPFQPMVTVRTGGREIDACVGFTELFIDNGKDKNLTNCEVYNASKKRNRGVVCGELGPLLGYVPGLAVKVDDIGHVVDIKVEKQ